MTTDEPHRTSWRQLFRIACDLIEQVNSDVIVIERWTFGGGTALMLQIGHHDSRDVDIFFQDPQYLGFLNSDVRDFAFETAPTAYEGDGSRFARGGRHSGLG